MSISRDPNRRNANLTLHWGPHIVSVIRTIQIPVFMQHAGVWIIKPSSQLALERCYSAKTVLITAKITTTVTTRALRDCKLCQDLHVIRDSNPDFRINPDPDLDNCRIGPKMYWIHSLVSLSHSAKYRKHRPVTVWEMLINLLKSPIPWWWEKWKSNPESVSGTRSSLKVNRF